MCASCRSAVVALSLASWLALNVALGVQSSLKKVGCYFGINCSTLLAIACSVSRDEVGLASDALRCITEAVTLARAPGCLHAVYQASDASRVS